MNKQLLPMLLALSIANVYADQSTSYTYNDKGQIASIDGPRIDIPDITQYQYNSQGQLAKLINPVGHTVTYNNYDKSGKPSTITDQNGLITTLTYTTEGWLATSTQSGLTTTYTYDVIGQLIKVVFPDNSSLTYQWDNAKRLLSITNNLKESINYSYDAMGNRTEETVKKGTVLTQQIKRQFDELGRIKALIKTDNKTYQYTYGNHDKPLTEQDPKGNTQSYTWDGLYRLSITRNNNTKEFSYYQYDLANNIIHAQSMGSIITKYTYDKTNNQTAENSTARKLTNYEYDEAGNLIKQTNGRGNITQYRYDAINRLIDQLYPNKPENNIHYNYDQPTAGFYNIGFLTSVNDPSGTTEYNYNNQGLIAQQKNQLKLEGNPLDTQQTTQYTYDKLGRVLKTDYGTLSLNYTRNTGGQVSAVTMTKGGKNTVLANGIAYTPFAENITGLTWGNGLTLTRSYNLDSQLTQQKIGAVTTTYQYDLNDNIIQIADSQFGTVNYQYDPFNRLTQEQAATTINYTYNPFGNRLTKSSDTEQQNIRYDQGNLYTINGIHFARDTVQNITAYKDKTKRYEYDETNRFAKVIKIEGKQESTLAAYIHNAFGERTIKVNQDGRIDTFMYSDQGQLIKETQYSANKQKIKEIYWVWLDTLPIAQIEIPFINNIAGTQTISYIHADHLNTPRWATNTAKQTIWTWQSDAFGTTMANEDPRNTGTKTTIPLRFPGQYFDKETGFHYNYFRTYIPDLGRYSQSDPIGLEGGWNTFGYVEGNPLQRSDVKGLFWYLGGDAQVTIVHDGGTKVFKNPSSNTLTNFINSLPNNSIQKIIIFGHGSKYGIEYNPKSKESIMTDGQGMLVFDSGAGVADVLNLKLQDDSYIMLEGCNTAFGDNNITKQFSDKFPNSSVRGYRTYGFSNMIFGGSSSVGIGKTYKGGKVIGW